MGIIFIIVILINQFICASINHKQLQNLQYHHFQLIFILLMIINYLKLQMISAQQYCYSTTVLHSYQLTQVNHMKLFLQNEEKKGLILAKSNTIEVWILQNNQAIDSLEISPNCNIVKIEVIPSKYKKSDIVFVLDNKNRFIFFRINEQKKIQLIAKQSSLLQMNKVFEKTEIYSGIDYIFNVNDTEGFIFYCVGESVVIINFVEKLDGFKILNYLINNFNNKIKFIDTIPKRFSKLKHNALAIIHTYDQKSHFRVYNTSLVSTDLMNIDKLNLINFFGGQDLILLSLKEVFMYSYGNNKPFMSYRIPIINSINQIIYLEEVYCMLGDQLIIFNSEGIKNYGEFFARSAVHIGGNKILVEHEDQDALLVQLEDENITQIKRWINLGNIFSVQTIQDSGEQIFVVVSPNKKKKISIFSKSQGVRSLINEQLEQPINKIEKIELNDGLIYIMVSFFDDSFCIMKVMEYGLEEIYMMDMKLIFSHPKYLIMENGIYEFNFESQIRLELNEYLNSLVKQNKILRGEISESLVVYQTSNNALNIINLKRNISNVIHLENSLSCLTVCKDNIFYSQWTSKKLHIMKEGVKTKNIEIQANILDLKCMKNYVFVGYRGKVEIYKFYENLFLQKSSQFFGGTLPLKFQIINDTTMYCLSNKSSIITIERQLIEIKSLGVRNLSGILSLPAEKMIVASNRQLSIIQIKKEQKISTYEISVNSDTIPFVKILNKQIHVFTPKVFEIYDPFTQEKRTFKHELDQIECIQKVGEGLVVGGQIQKYFVLIYYKDRVECARILLKKKPKLIRSISQNQFGVILVKQFKIFKIQGNKLIEILSNQIQDNPYSLDIKPDVNKLILSDPVKSIILYDYNLNTHKITPLSRFVCDRICNQIAFLGDYIIQTDKTCNLFITQPQLNSINDLQKINLKLRGGLNMGEQIWAISKHDKKIIYGTASGTIGKIHLIEKRQFSILKQIESILIEETEKIGFKYDDWRQIKLSYMPKIDMSNNCLVDGDILKILKKYNWQELIQILGKLTKEITCKQLNQILEKIEKIGN